MSDREELVSALHRAIGETFNIEPYWAQMDAMADVLLAKGYRKTYAIYTREDLDLLPVGVVVADLNNKLPRPHIWVKTWQSKHPRKDGTPLSEWNQDDIPEQTQDIPLPATVLHEPEATS